MPSPYDANTYLNGEGKWRCTRCGACCTFVSLLPPLKHLDRGDGVCKNLRIEPVGTSCAVFEERPELCRTKQHVPDLARAVACAQVNLVVAARRS